MHQLKDSGMLTDAHRKEMEQIDREIRQKEVAFKRLQSEMNPELIQFSRCVRGKPRAEVCQPNLLEVIQEIASAGASAQSRRRSEQLSSVELLDDLHDALLQEGYCLSRSATYLRL